MLSDVGGPKGQIAQPSDPSMDNPKIGRKGLSKLSGFTIIHIAGAKANQS
jgi:hypothetical protein